MDRSPVPAWGMVGSCSSSGPAGRTLSFRVIEERAAIINMALFADRTTGWKLDSWSVNGMSSWRGGPPIL